MVDKVAAIICLRANSVTLFVMTELEKRDITPPAAAEKLMDGLKTLVETFGGSNELRQTVIELEGGE